MIRNGRNTSLSRNQPTPLWLSSHFHQPSMLYTTHSPPNMTRTVSAVIHQPVITSVLQEFELLELLQHLRINGTAGLDRRIAKLVSGRQGRILQRTQQHSHTLLQRSTLCLLFAVVEDRGLGHLEVVEFADESRSFLDEKQ